MATSNATAGGHIAVCPLPFASHPASLLRLCRKIAAGDTNTLRITLFATAASTPSLMASLSPEEAAKIKILALDDGRRGGVGGNHPLDGIRLFIDVAGESLRKGIVAAEEMAGVKITCIVTDGFLGYAVRKIADERGAKWAVMWTSAASGFASYLHNHELRRVEAHKEDPMDRYVPGFPRRIADLPHEVVAADDSNPIAKILRVMYLHVPTAAAIAVNSFQALEPGVISTLSSVFGDKLFPAGPYALTLQTSTGPTQDPHGCLPWLDARGPTSVVYISFGTAHSPPPEEFCALAESLEATGAEFLWSLSDRLQAQLPKGFAGRAEESGNGKIVPWAPQQTILAHLSVGAHLTHCGWNSVMDSVLGGVPIIGRPFGIADQAFNKKMVESVWRIGVGVEAGKLTKIGVEKAVETVMKGEEGRGMRERIREMKKLAEEVAKSDGASVENVDKFINIITT